MLVYLMEILAASIFFPCIAGLIRFKKIHHSYFPFLLCIWVGTINEIISITLIRYGYYSAFNNNIYVLAESLLIAWQFKNWGAFQKRKWMFETLLSLFLICWVIKNFVIADIKRLRFISG